MTIPSPSSVQRSVLYKYRIRTATDLRRKTTNRENNGESARKSPGENFPASDVRGEGMYRKDLVFRNC
jgi:hypothetical protein